MIRLAENDVGLLKDKEGYEQARIEEERKSRIQYLEIMLEQEREEILRLEKLMDHDKKEAVISCIRVGISILIFIYLWKNAMSTVLSLVQRPWIALLVLGGMIKFISDTVLHVRKHIPMFIWCEQERNGKVAKHDNYVRQYRNQVIKYNKMEEEFNQLKMIGEMD